MSDFGRGPAVCWVQAEDVEAFEDCTREEINEAFKDTPVALFLAGVLRLWPRAVILETQKGTVDDRLAAMVVLNWTSDEGTPYKLVVVQVYSETGLISSTCGTLNDKYDSTKSTFNEILLSMGFFN